MNESIEQLKAIIENEPDRIPECNLGIYFHYHVSQANSLPEPIKKAWFAGQDFWVKKQTELD